MPNNVLDACMGNLTEFLQWPNEEDTHDKQSGFVDFCLHSKVIEQGIDEVRTLTSICLQRLRK